MPSPSDQTSHLRQRGTPSTSTPNSEASRPTTTDSAPQPNPPQQPQSTLRSRAVAGAMGVGIFTAAVGGTYFFSNNDSVFPFAVAACVATFSLIRIALQSVPVDGAQRARARNFRAHRHFTGERAAYVRTSQRLAMMDRDFTDADYEMLLDLDNNSQRLRRFLEGASHETVAQLRTIIYQKTDKSDRETGEEEPERPASAGDWQMAQKEQQISEKAGDTLHKCTICLEDFEDGMKIRILPCSHRFMAECIDPWLVQQARCPVCKENIHEVMNTMPPESS